MRDILKRKIFKEKSKAKRSKILLKLLQACILGDVGVIECTLKEIVPIKQS